ncbi:MAG: signal transduction histidine kinase [Paracoccaceae bacterium]
MHKAAVDPLTRSEQVIIVEDITETQLLESKLTHQERLASIGRLAAGVAHEIGNPVTGIACLAQNLRYETEPPEVIESAEQIVKQTQRITSIVQSLVNFAHQGRDAQHVNFEAVNVRHCVDEAIQLLKLDLEAIKVIFDNRCSDNLIAHADNQRLIQVFINLFSNARDASQAGDSITINAHIDEQLHISVCDRGSGIPEHAMEKIFEPFFTTKEPGKGTGLGLALVYNIVDDIGGEISIESPVSGQLNGTCVRLKLQIFSE